MRNNRLAKCFGSVSLSWIPHLKVFCGETRAARRTRRGVAVAGEWSRLTSRFRFQRKTNSLAIQWPFGVVKRFGIKGDHVAFVLTASCPNDK